MEHFTRAGVHASLGDLRLWYLELAGAYNMVAPWMGKKYCERIKKELDGECGRVYGVVDFMRRTDALANFAREPKRREVEKTLLQIHGDILESARHMMLPTGADEAYTDWDARRFMEESQ